MSGTPELFESVCVRGAMRLHVPLIRYRGRWYNANTGCLEPWVISADRMAANRAVAFEAIAARTMEAIR